MMRDKNKVKLGVLIFVALLAMFSFVGCVGAKTWYVDDDGGYDFMQIQDAINAASPSDTILVYNGTYEEKITIKKDSLNIIGENRDCVIIKGGVTFAPSTNNNLIENTTIINNDGSGIIVSGSLGNILASNNNMIKSNKILNNVDGIYISYGSKGNVIENNTILNNRYNGIIVDASHLWGTAHDNKITNNTVINNTNYDIYLRPHWWGDVYNNTVTDNIARRIHGNLHENTVRNNIYPRPVISSSYSTTTPAIDGIISEGEWKNKIEIKLNGFADDDHYDGKDNECLVRTVELYVMNDADNIYIAVVMEEALEEDEDYLYFGFDQGDDFIPMNGDEDRAYLNGSGYADGHWNIDDWALDAISNGEMCRDWNVGDRKYIYEFKKPLDSGDPQDMKLKAGDIVGFRIEVYDEYSGRWSRYPMDTVDHDSAHSKDEDIIFTPPVGDESGSWKKWADLITAKEPTSAP